MPRRLASYAIPKKDIASPERINVIFGEGIYPMTIKLVRMPIVLFSLPHLMNG
jgi:uncharacterized membrane protein